MQVDRAVEQIMRLANEQYQKRVAPAADGQTPAAGVKSSGEYTVYPLRAVRELIVNAVVHRTYCLVGGGVSEAGV
jgi:predicted HTH transcriptional regulator